MKAKKKAISLPRPELWGFSGAPLLASAVGVLGSVAVEGAVAPEGSDGVEDDAGLLTADDKRNTPIKVSGETCGRTLLEGVTFQTTPA